MKRLLIILLCGILILSGCANQQETSATIPQMAPETVPETLPETVPDSTTETEHIEAVETELISVAVPATTEDYALEDGTALFSYTAQHMQLLLPNESISDKVILNFLNRVDAARTDADAVLAVAQNDYTPDAAWIPYFYQIIYSPTRIDHNVLSLFGTQSSYSGGVHGNLSGVSANYDLSTGDILTLGSIMHKDADKEKFINLVIEKLSIQASTLQLFEGFEEGVYSRLGGDENLYEDFYFTSSGLAFFFAPYEIAPYSAGIITVEIPYEELTGLIYDGYFPAERELVQGKMQASPFMDTDMTQFNNMEEVKLTSGEEIVVAYPEGKVEDIRIIMSGDGKNMPEYTVFAALEMSSNNAVVLSIATEDVERFSIDYLSEGHLETLSLD